MPPCVCNGGIHPGICLPVYHRWYTPGYMPPGVPKVVYTRVYASLCVPKVVYTRVYASHVPFVGESGTTRPVPRRALTRFTVGRMLGSLLSAHLSTLCQKGRHPAGLNGAPGSPYPFHCWRTVGACWEESLSPSWYMPTSHHPGYMPPPASQYGVYQPPCVHPSDMTEHEPCVYDS